MKEKQKKIMTVVGAALFLCLLWWGWQGQEKDGAGQQDGTTQNREETETGEKIATGEEIACSCVTSLNADGREGSCVILQAEGEHYILATAAHVTEKKPETVRLGGQEVTVTDYYKSGDYDLAFLAVEKEKGESLNLFPATLDTGAYENVQGGEGIILCGVVAGEKISQKGVLGNNWIYIEDFGYHMLWGKAENIRGGMSGGGVFDGEGRLLGILLGSGGEDEIAALPLTIMAGEWKKSDLGETIDIFSK